MARQRTRLPPLRGEERTITRDNIADALAHEAEQAEKHRDDEVSYVRHRRPPQEPSQVYSLRLPVDRLEALRRLAEQRHMTPSALMRTWILEQLDAEAADVPAPKVDRDELRAIVRDELAEALETASQGSDESGHLVDLVAALRASAQRDVPRRRRAG